MHAASPLTHVAPPVSGSDGHDMCSNAPVSVGADVGLPVCPGVGLLIGPGVDFPPDPGVGLLVCPGVGLLVGWRVRLVAPGIVYSSDPANGTGGLLGSGKNAHFPLLYAKALHVSRVVSLFRTSLHFFTQLVNVDTSFPHVFSMSSSLPV